MYGGDINEIFAFHPATETTGPIHDQIRVAHRGLAKLMDDLLPPSPEATTAIRKLQEAMMFANSAVAIHSPKGEPRNPFSGRGDDAVKFFGGDPAKLEPQKNDEESDISTPQ